MSHLRPLGHRLLITPDPPVTATTSGLVLPEDRDHLPVSGTVAAVGDGPKRDQRIRLASITRCISIVEELAEMGVHGTDTLAELRRYRNAVERFDGCIAVGDRVVYPVEVGLRVTEDGTGYILLNEDDVAIVADDAGEVAA